MIEDDKKEKKKMTDNPNDISGSKPIYITKSLDFNPLPAKKKIVNEFEVK